MDTKYKAGDWVILTDEEKERVKERYGQHRLVEFLDKPKMIEGLENSSEHRIYSGYGTFIYTFGEENPVLKGDDWGAYITECSVRYATKEEINEEKIKKIF